MRPTAQHRADTLVYARQHEWKTTFSINMLKLRDLIAQEITKAEKQILEPLGSMTVDGVKFLGDGIIEWVESPWDCPHSPSQICRYNIREDPAMNDCIHCHEPSKRK